MGKKGKKRLLDKLRLDERVTYEIKKRNPDFQKDFEEFKSRTREIHREISKIAKEGNYVKEHRYVKLSNELKELRKQFFKKHVISPNGVENVLEGRALNIGGNSVFWETPLKEVIEEIIPGRKRYLQLYIDTFQERELIQAGISEILDFIDEDRKNLKVKIPKRGLHLDKALRHIEIFDLRSKKPPEKFKTIALILMKKGFYKNKDLEQVTNNIKQEFRAIFKEIFGMPYPKYNKKQFRQLYFKECKNCDKRSGCKELCPEAAYIIAQEEVKQRHFIGSKPVDEFIDI